MFRALSTKPVLFSRATTIASRQPHPVPERMKTSKPSRHVVNHGASLVKHTTQAMMLEEHFRLQQPVASTHQVDKFMDFAHHFPTDDWNEHLASHSIDSIEPKLALLKMLETPADKLSKETIDKTRHAIGVPAIKNYFLEKVAMLFKEGGGEDADTYNNIYTMSRYPVFASFESQIEQADTLKDLRNLYHMNGSGFAAVLKTIDHDKLLDFFLDGRMDNDIHASLKSHCKNRYYFMSMTSLFHVRNKNEFSVLKPVIDNIALYLTQLKYRKTSSLLFPLPNLFHDVHAATTEVMMRIEFDNHGYMRENHPQQLKEWHTLRRQILNKPALFQDGSRMEEQMFVVMKDARKAGIPFEHSHDLVDHYIQVEKREAARDRRFARSMFSDAHMRHSILDMMEKALQQGNYQQTVDRMMEKCREPQHEVSTSSIRPR